MGFKQMPIYNTFRLNPGTGNLHTTTGFHGCALDCLQYFNDTLASNFTDTAVITHNNATGECILWSRYLFMGEVQESTINVFIKEPYLTLADDSYYTSMELAKSKCESYGGTLPTPMNADSLEFLTNTIPDSTNVFFNFFIGMKDVDNASSLQYLNGTTVDYTVDIKSSSGSTYTGDPAKECVSIAFNGVVKETACKGGMPLRTVCDFYN